MTEMARAITAKYNFDDYALRLLSRAIFSLLLLLVVVAHVYSSSVCAVDLVMADERIQKNMEFRQGLCVTNLLIQSKMAYR